MRLIYEGKTKTVFDLENGYYMLRFKDDVTGTDGVFDPGANTVGLSIEGIGRAGVRLTDFFYNKINEAGLPTHFVSADIERAEITVLPAVKYGSGLEVICRYRAVGSFLRRFGIYVTEGQKLDALIEVTLKDDDNDDPPITRSILEMLNIMTGEEYDSIEFLTKKISALISDILADRNLELYDIKLEFGRVDGRVCLIDEISGGNMRVYREDGKIVEPMELVRLVLEEDSVESGEEDMECGVQDADD